MKKKFAPFLLSLIIAFNVCAIPALASSDEDKITSTVEQYLSVNARIAYLYEDHDLQINSVRSLENIAEQDSKSADQSFQLLSRTASLSQLQNGLKFVENKAYYNKYYRQAEGINRTDFCAAYTFSDVKIHDSAASVCVYELISFRYVGNSELSSIGTNYVVDLINVGGKWLVADVNSDDEFDIVYKSIGFDLNTAIQNYNNLKQEREANSEGSEAVKEDSDEKNHRSIDSILTTTNLSYNRNNVVAYAFTYTTQEGNTNPNYNGVPYYNPNFVYYSANCMNFASQCVWAGFGGDNTTTSIDGHIAPMDDEGASDSYKWCGKYSSNGIKTASWTSCSNFRTYVNNSSGQTGEGLQASIVDVSTSQNFTQVPSYSSNLLGSVLHVKGYDSNGNPVNYGHAIVVTQVDGPDRDDVYVCSNTRMAKHYLLADNSYWANNPIKVIVPEYFRASSVTAPIITPSQKKPVAQNATTSLTATTNQQCYRIYTTVTKPSGQLYTYTSSYNTSSYSCSHSFNEIGLYKVTVYAKLTSTSSEVSKTYYVRAYEV
ncbi:hypothetical protein SDC9_51419 [bioreactor metagenome]|uniref:Putative amidase domain-containing protein n=1 Tax=bioreactor metagenome TaxID=1076179 RepID=A0A644WS97_9ZZZZ|nr:amidase domain-containing protein [Pseudoflavonifractor sp.]